MDYSKSGVTIEGNRLNYNGLVENIKKSTGEIIDKKGKQIITNMSLWDKVGLRINNLKIWLFGDENLSSKCELNKEEIEIYNKIERNIILIKNLNSECFPKPLHQPFNPFNTSEYQKLISTYANSAIEISKLQNELKGTKIEFSLIENGYNINEMLLRDWDIIKADSKRFNEFLFSKFRNNLNINQINGLKKILKSNEGAIVRENKVFSNIDEVIKDFKKIDSIIFSFKEDDKDKSMEDMMVNKGSFVELKQEKYNELKKLYIDILGGNEGSFKDLKLTDLKKLLEEKKGDMEYLKFILSNIDERNVKTCALLMENKEGLKKAINKLKEIELKDDSQKMWFLMGTIKEDPGIYGIDSSKLNK